MLDTTPSLAELLVKECQSRDIELPSMLIGGEAMPTELWSTLAQYYQQHESFALNVYGPTECTVNSTFADIEVNSKPNIGRGLPNVSLYVMNNAQQLLPVGAKGELYIGGEGVTAGYINNPELNAASFIDSDEFGRLYKSGDLVRWNHSGQLEFIGRSDFQVKLRGYRIELEEIENVALQHPIVDEVAVLVKDQQLVAYLVPDQAHESHIKSFLETRLPAYMVPSHIVMLAEMPVTANGKRDRKALLSIDVSTDTTRYLPPETKMELAVQAIWSELLGQDNISVDANFFEIGGHSLLGIRLASACRERLGVELPLKVLMEGPTIRCLAEQCDWYEKQRQVLACADQLSNEREDSERIVI
jgi:acyl-coenzyme A synthetase/AMP-(fatty) acid ligase/acyl carrier protein